MFLHVFRNALKRKFVKTPVNAYAWHMPSTSKLKTTAAIVRNIIGFKTAGEMAGWLAVSEDTVRSVETGRIPLSEKMIRQYAKLGVSPRWLTNGDVEAPAITPDGEPYTKEVFERATAENAWVFESHSNEIAWAVQTIAVMTFELLSQVKAKSPEEIPATVKRLHLDLINAAEKWGSPAVKAVNHAWKNIAKNEALFETMKDEYIQTATEFLRSESRSQS
jgi:hypothetical protein